MHNYSRDVMIFVFLNMCITDFDISLGKYVFMVQNAS